MKWIAGGNRLTRFIHGGKTMSTVFDEQIEECRRIILFYVFLGRSLSTADRTRGSHVVAQVKKFKVTSP